MIKAGARIYAAWEHEHIFDGMGGAAPYAVRELVTQLLCAHFRIRNVHKEELH
jgi:hypothetical protein